MCGKFQKRSSGLQNGFWKSFGNLRKVVVNLQKIIKNIVISTGLLIFCAVAELRISRKSAKSREILRNSLEILPNTCRHNMFESYLGCWGCLLAVNLLNYLETLSLQRVNNIPKLPGVVRLMLQKTGQQP